MPDRTEPKTPVVAPPPEAAPRRKSSWESLANMFNIKVDRSKPAEVAQDAQSVAPESTQPRSARPTEAASKDDDRPFGIFSEDRPARSNPALDAMFGETPAPSQSSRDDWGKPRVIDDLGWDDDDKRSSQSSDSSAAQDDAPRGRSSSEAGGSEAAHSENGEEPPRRGRRRRRGRRGRSDSAASSTDSAPTTDSTRSWGGLDADSDDDAHSDSEHGLHDDPWGEPDSFELIQSDSLDEQDSNSDDGADELSADGEVLRRSSRRRRRGRSSGEREAGGTASEPAAPRDSARGRTAPRTRSTSDDDGPVGFRSDRDDDDHDNAADQLDAPRAAQGPRRGEGEESDDRGSRPRRRRRGGSSDKEPGARRGGDDSPSRAPAAEGAGRTSASRRPARPFDDEGPIEDSFDDASLGPDGDEGESVTEDGQRRSIPTWADSIASLIQTNTENRKRGDNRGAPRGRPRGRR